MIEHVTTKPVIDKPPYFDVVKVSSRWRLRTVLEGQANIIHSNAFTSRKRCQNWADRMNNAARTAS